MRHSAKVLFLDPEHRTLLFEGCNPNDPSAGTWWFAPGGGVEDGETFEQAARREVWEETGQRITALGPHVTSTQESFTFMGRRIRQRTAYFIKTTAAFTVDRSGWTDLEQASIVDVRWWPREELRTTSSTLWPADIADLLDSAEASG